jgi:cytochrome oxidase assembly protein ShyY1
VRRFRFLLSRRWVLFLVTVLALAWLAWRLGEWQFDRLEERQQRNAVVERNESLPPVPVTEVMAVGEPVSAGEQWRVVRATGEYAVEDTVIVRYRTRDGAAGVDVVVPLVLADGTSVLVDRGWFATDNRGTTAADVPPPPDGEVTVTGWVRANATGDSTAVADRSTRAVSSREIGPALDREVLGGFVDLRSEDPAPRTALEPVEQPELDDGPHFFYGLQWWFFGLLALVGFGYLAYDEWRGRPSAGRRRTEEEAPADGSADRGALR